MNDNFNLVATTYAGLEPLLLEELKSLGATDASEGRRMVSFKGDLGMIYKANYRSRFALRILREVGAFDFRDQDAYYDNIKAIPWESFMTEKNTLAVQAVTSGELMPHSRYAAQRAKDAIVDRFREQNGVRPSVDLDRPDIRINAHIRNDRCHISLDSSGEPLHKRGWRREMGIAPLSEVMSAALVKLSGWDAEGEFLDPMCGSGTIVIEAAMQALNIPAGKYRRFFSFYKWPGFDAALWQQVRSEADALTVDKGLHIRGSDASWKAVAAAETNLQQAGLGDVVKIEKKPFQANFPRKPRGIIVTNPPYDERIRSRNNNMLYRELGDVMKKRFQGYQAWLFSGDLNALKNVGLKAGTRHVLYNGPIECRLVSFDLFAGSAQDKTQEKDQDE